ncbi:hypothetical protein G9F73_011530 [Clostridium estertheticum]|uniref:hypothetical protein n=1 Tax=Clostridium estertheticum TaxID=238834 RepID=UPI0013EE7954|nr:hypothetical protein [Clostridium estertheticum]MBZ9608440.1 hypothetical protein [Clostridium estertheticum]
MGMGYTIGCLISILLWRVDRQGLFGFINVKLKEKIKNIYMLQFLYLCGVIAIYSGIAFLADVTFIKSNQVFNAITAFMVIDISNTERKSLNNTERKHFYDTISTISRSLICGFIAPLFYILILGNGAAIVFTLLYIITLDKELNILGILLTCATIIPAIIAEIFLYIIYVFRNQKVKIDFKGDYANNIWNKPTLNVDILAAYIESVNFYFHYNGNDMHYLKSYGGYSDKVDDACVKDYLSISYSICFIVFTVFLVLQFL